jgi:hypothetical protein
MASLNSEFLIKIFKVKKVLTFLNLQYCIAFFNVGTSKLFAEALALNRVEPKYTLSAPF